jgi:hypothetical protein
MKMIDVYGTTMVTVNLEYILNIIKQECIPNNVYLDDHGLYRLEEPNGKKLDVDFSSDRTQQIKDILNGISAIKKFYGIQYE